jgi:GWxTD domain-containing protein
MVNFFVEMKGTDKVIYSIILMMVCQMAAGLYVSKINLAYQYDIQAEIRFSHRTVQSGNAIKVLYEVKSDTSRHWSLHFLTQKGYESALHDTLRNFVIDTLLIEKRRSLVSLEFKVPINMDLLLVVFNDSLTNTTFYFDVIINTPGNFPAYYPVDPLGLPIVKTYINTDEIGLMGYKNNYHCYQYGQKFIGTDPPMGQMKPLAPTLDIDTAFNFQPPLANLEEDAFYLIQNDSLDQTGITLLKVPNYFPEMKRIDELVGPLQYITTESENKSLNSGVNTKALFERFWINTYGSKFAAKGAIRSYYNKVEGSNQLFTDYKAGWKTDRGMLYIVFGRPDEVIRTKNSEIWKYSDGPEFEFIRISTLFAPSLYSLKRAIKYEDVWYNRVGNIRNG